MNQPVKGETDADPTLTNQLSCDKIMLWKTFQLSSGVRATQSKAAKYSFPCASHCHQRGARFEQKSKIRSRWVAISSSPCAAQILGSPAAACQWIALQAEWLVQNERPVRGGSYDGRLLEKRQ